MEVIGEATYYSKNYHKKEGKYRSNWEKGVTRILYIPLDVEKHMGLKHGDIIEFVANGDGDINIREAS